MVSREELKGKWNAVKSRLQENWKQLTDEDLKRFEAGTDRLVGTIEQKTGASRREVEDFLNQCVQEAENVSARTREYADQAAEALKESYRRASESTEQISQRIGETVSRRPVQAVAVALAVGAVAGCLFAMARRR